MSIEKARFSRILAGGAGIALALAVSACATPTPYAPAAGSGYARNGYADEQIEADRYRVSFSGNSLTSRETVERYLLYRSAQLTLERGYDHFVLVDRDTEKKTRTYVDSDPFGYGFGGYGFWGPSWRYHGRGYGWRGFGGGFGGGYGDPFGNDFDVRTIDKYEAIAEIRLGHGPKPATDVHAFDARQVIDNLGPKVQPPRAG